VTIQAEYLHDLNHMEGRGRLRDRLARPAAELLAHVLGHEPLLVICYCLTLIVARHFLELQ
jgi:hypothetical protein